MASQPAVVPALPTPEPLPPPVPHPIPIIDPARHSGDRNSRFIEPPMREYTPPDSLYYDDDDDDDDDFRVRRDAVKARVFLRALNALVHMGACAVLLAIMGRFLSLYKGSRTRTVVPPAATILALASLDACLDAFTLATARRSRPGWSLFLRLLVGVGYLAVFIVYAGFGGVFPANYTYWGVSAGFAGPVVYLFLWLLGVWDLLNVVLNRRRFTRGVRAGVTRLKGLYRPGSASPRTNSGFVPARGRINMRTGSRRFWTRGRAASGGARVSDRETGQRAGAPPAVAATAHTQTVHPKAEGESRSAEQKSDSPTPSPTSANSGEPDAEGERPPPAPV